MWRVAVACTLALVLGACDSQRAALPASCGAPAAQVVAALASAPQAVLMADGTPLSRCVRDADSTAELENVGVSLHGAAQLLRDRADAGAAVELGYLVGATRKGARGSPGVSSELAVRVGRVAGRLIAAEPALRADVQRGVRAGERLG
jgi:hypothetical protein